MDYIIAIEIPIVGLIILAVIWEEFRNLRKELIQKMADLETAVQGVKDAFAAAVTGMTDATNAAADRVIASLKSGVDPSAAIAELEALKQSVSDAGQAEIDKLNAIDPSAKPTPQ